VITKEPHVAFGQIGLEIMAALLKEQGHEVVGIGDSTYHPSKHVTTTDERRNLKILEDFDPDFVGFCSLTHRYQWELKFSRMVRQELPDARIVFGGPHATVVPNVIAREPHIDYVCVGEGEYAMLELVEEPDRDDIMNIYPNPLRPLITDLDSLPFPDKTIWLERAASLDDFRTYLIVSARGCPFRCSYCFNCVLMDMAEGLGPWLRYRSPENVVAELIEAKKRFPIEFVLFQEDNLGLSKPFMRKFAPLYKKRVRLPYSGNTHPLVIDEERVRLFKESGCRFLMLGLQSGNEQVRRLHGRGESNECIREAARLLHKYGIPFSVDHLFGLPGADKRKYMEESALLYNEIRPFTVNTYRLYTLPKTPVLKLGDYSPEFLKRMEQGTHQEVTIRATDNPRYVAFRNFFVFLPFLPRSVVKFIIAHPNILDFFGSLPETAIWVGKGINNLRGGNVWLVAKYLKSTPKFIAQRLSGYRGEFEKPGGDVE